MRQLFDPLAVLYHPMAGKHPQSLADRLHGNALGVQEPVCFPVRRFHARDSLPLPDRRRKAESLESLPSVGASRSLSGKTAEALGFVSDHTKDAPNGKTEFIPSVWLCPVLFLAAKVRSAPGTKAKKPQQIRVCAA